VLRILLSPRWVAVHVLFAAAVVAMAVLGSWQLDSYERQRSERELRRQPAVDVAALSAPGDALPAASVGRNVTVSGTYEPGAEVLVPSRVLAGVAGWYVLAPLRTDGGTVLVLRGWVDDDDDPAVRTPDGAVTVVGVLRPDEGAEASVPLGRDLRDGEIPYVAGELALAETGLPTGDLYAGWVLSSTEEPRADPAPEPVPVEEFTDGNGAGMWQNLSYAGQWWLFAAAAAVFWASLVRNAVRGGRRRGVVEVAEREPAGR
jgi:cytochrome oxidase assembly protein ShyY1